MASDESVRRWRGDGAIKVQEEDLDHGIWSKTPPEIQRRLLDFLPLVSLCRFRCVSKSWKKVMSTISLTNTKLKPSKSGEPWFIAAIDRERGLNLVCTGSLLNDRPEETFAFIDTHPAKSGMTIATICTAAGLVLATNSPFTDFCQLFVYNPFVLGSGRYLEAFSKIPRISGTRLEYAGLHILDVTSDGKASFAAICITAGDLPRMHVFDSRSWSWVTKSVPLGSTRGEYVYLGRDSGNQNSVVLENELLYYLTGSTKDSDIGWLKCVNIWDPENTCKTLASWTSLPLGLEQPIFDPSSMQPIYPALIKSQGKLMLVKLTSHPPYGAIGFLCLNEESQSWEVFKSVPLDSFPESVKEMNKKKEMVSGCLWAMAIPGGSKVALSFLDSGLGFILDLADCTWSGTYPCDELVPFQPSFFTF